jgi:predicted RNase H-like nuclease
MGAGVDGCRGGWVVVHHREAWVVGTFAEVVASLPDDTVIGIDIPVGLLDHHAPGGRACDRAARRRLGAGRSSSVFSAPPRPALGLRSLPEAQAAGFPMTLQTVHILAKVADVDASMDPTLQRRVHEVHPELAFVALADGVALQHPKRRAAGRVERRDLLDRHGIPIPDRPRGAAVDDLLDACAVAWSTTRIEAGTAERVPDDGPRLDARGLRMEICW